MQVTSLMMCKHFWLLNKGQSTNLHKFRIDWQTTIFAEHFGANNVILWWMVQNLSCAKLRVVFCGIYYVTTVTINGINRMHMLSVLLTALFRIFWKLHFRLFCSTIKYVYKTLHFLVKQLHNTTSAVNNYHSSFHHNYHTKTGILHWLWIQEGSSTSYVSLHSSVNVVWHHSTCPTNFKQVARMEPRQRLRSSSSPALVVPATRRSSLGNQTFLVAAARAWNSHCCINPAFIPSSPENSSVHRIFSTTLVTLSAFWANVTCFWLC